MYTIMEEHKGTKEEQKPSDMSFTIRGSWKKPYWDLQRN